MSFDVLAKASVEIEQVGGGFSDLLRESCYSEQPADKTAARCSSSIQRGEMNWWVDRYWDDLEKKRKVERRVKTVRQSLMRQAGKGEFEILLELSSKGERVIPQHPVLEYFCDLYLPERKLILEISSVRPGSKKWRRLMERKARIEAEGYRVVYVPSKTAPEAIWRYVT